MSIQYAGGVAVHQTFTQTLGTRAELATWVKDRLVDAGWTVVATATNDWKLNSAITPQNLQMRARVYDPGSGSARIRISNVPETRIHASDFYILPAIGRAWRILANRYQCFLLPVGGPIDRADAFFGVPYIPPFLEGITTEAIWGMGGASGETTTISITFRSSLSTYGNSPTEWMAYNGVALAVVNANRVASIRLVFMGNTPLQPIYRWSNDNLLAYEPLVGWGINTIDEEPRIRGQLWNSVIISEGFAADSSISFDARTFRAITVGNGATSTTPMGTLFIAES